MVRETFLAVKGPFGLHRGGKLLLMPVDEAQQMRPHMAHLDEPAVKPAALAVKAEAPSDELSLLTVRSHTLQQA